MSTKIGSAYLWGACLPFLLILSGVACLFTHSSGPPRNKLMVSLWLLTSFVMCIFWVYLFASELVSALQTLGLVMGVSPSVLALTVLARPEEHTSELQSLMRISYAVFCLKKK